MELVFLYNSPVKFICLLLSLCCVAADAQTEPEHGTVNVLLAQRDSLVVVTDSMLTNAHGHSPTGVKLYQIDDRTICAMAGFYGEPGPNSLDAFAASMPRIIQILQARSGSGSFQGRAEHLQFMVEDQLKTHFDSILTTIPDFNLNNPDLGLELTVAGYDLDGSLQIADITIRPKRTPAGISFESVDRPLGKFANPPCEFAAKFKVVAPNADLPWGTGLAIHSVGNSLFCDIAGIPDVAEELLAHPSAHSNLSGLTAYAQSERGTTLSLDDLRSLALLLVDQTVAEERKNGMFRVGGPPQIAVLSGGRIVEGPPPLSKERTGSALPTFHFESNVINCSPSKELIEAPSVPPHPVSLRDVQASWNGCAQTIDGIVIHDSIFRDSTIVYYGVGPILFGTNNTIVNTTLLFGPKVNVDDVAVHGLVCDFKWKAVYQDSKELNIDCKKESTTQIHSLN